MTTESVDEDEVIIEEVKEEKWDTKPQELPKPKTKIIHSEEWTHINAQPPLWTRDPKNVTDCR